MKNKQPGTVRIIAGKWRGTRLPVSDLPGLRPSGDRTRETLFNWLQIAVRGANCVDLFAGSGVLGLEAASRGAANVILVEKSKAACADIRKSLARLEAKQVELAETDALAWLSRCEAQTMDIVFIDPPFGSGLEARAFELLTAGNCVRDNGFVYVESARSAPAIAPGPQWSIQKEKTMGEVRLQLLEKV